MNANSANSNSDKIKQTKIDKNEKSEKNNLKIIYEKYLGELEKKFNEVEDEVKVLPNDPNNFKNHSLPLARIKKIMKLDDEVKMIAGETPILFSKACELFIIELAYRSWIHTLENNRRTLQRCDIANAISRTDFYDFLIDIVEESCRNKLHMCSNYQIDPLTVPYVSNYYPQMGMTHPINSINPMNIYYVPKKDEHTEQESVQSTINFNSGQFLNNPGLDIKNGDNEQQSSFQIQMGEQIKTTQINIADHKSTVSKYSKK